MLVDRYEAEDVFSRVPHMAARIDPVVSKLDQLLDDDELYHQVRADFDFEGRNRGVRANPLSLYFPQVYRLVSTLLLVFQATQR